MITSFRRAALAAGVLAALAAGNAHAALTVCRTDPAATLSNGAQVTLISDIATVPADIKKVTYQLHIPAGLTVTSVTYDPVYGALESFSWKADQDPGKYRDVTRVSTRTDDVQVRVTALVTGIACSDTPRWKDGSSGKNLIVPFAC